MKTGETMKIRVVKAPDRQYERRVNSFLSYNNELWLWHLNMAFRGELDELEARFYVGLLNGRMVGNVSSWEHGPLGLVAHLFTARRYRREGICTALMKAQVRDFRDRDGKMLIGGFRPTSYRIARTIGFRSIVGNSEVMHYVLDPNLERGYFKVQGVTCRDSMWKDWPGVGLLFGIKKGWRIRSMKHRIFTPFDYEDYFLEDMKERLDGSTMAKVLVNEKGNVAGYATLTFKRSPKSFWLLDFFVHHSATPHADMMLDAIDFPKNRTRCYVESDCSEKYGMLLERGFKERTQELIRHEGRTLDTIIMEF